MDQEHLVDELLRCQQDPALYSSDLKRREAALAVFREAARALVRHLEQRESWSITDQVRALLRRQEEPARRNTRWLKLDLIDDHHRADPKVLRDQIIGYVLSPGAVPVLVSCLTPGAWPHDAVCLNEVYTDQHRAHLSTRSVLTLLPSQRAQLHEEGEIRYGPSAVVRLLRAPDTD